MERDAARLLVLDRSTGGVSHFTVRDLAQLVEPGTLIVLNDTRVRKARLFGTRPGGGTTEVILLERNEEGLW